jgi:hypothetical protein
MTCKNKDKERITNKAVILDNVDARPKTVNRFDLNEFKLNRNWI